MKLMFIKGISRLDTPVFDTIEAQQRYFDYRVVYSPTDGYYPPYFKNTIQLEITDTFDYSVRINYLSFEFSGKIYYYFIDEIRYINEGLIELRITMDVIQTYMFDIKFINSKITRKSISRWSNSSTINRNYIRENFASGSEDVIKNSVLWDLNSEEYTIALIRYTPTAQFRAVTYVTDPGPDTVPLNTEYGAVIYGPNAVSLDGQAFMLFVFPNELNSSIEIVNGPNTGDSRTITLTTNGEVSLTIRALQEIPNVTSIHFLPGSYLPDIIENVSINGSTIDLTNTKFRIAKLENEITIGGVPSWSLYTNNVIVYEPFAEIPRKINMRKQEIDFGYVQNSAVDTPFDYKYVPALLDENYYRLKVGELGCNTGYPLHKSPRSKLYARYLYNWIDNVRAYSVTITNANTMAADREHTLVHYASIENLDLYTDAYLEYISRNYSTLTRGVALAKNQNMYGTVMSSISNLFGTGASVGKYSILSDIAGVKGELGAFGAKASVAQGISKQAITMMDYFQQDYVIDEQIGIKQDNAAFTPDQERTGNACNTDVIDGALRGFVWITADEMLQEIATIYESYGYAVSEVTTDNLLQSNIRYYYDVVQATNVNVYLDNLVNSEEVLRNIKDRFEGGLRLWHSYTNTLGNISLRINDVSLDMGSVCVYDNVESSYL